MTNNVTNVICQHGNIYAAIVSFLMIIADGLSKSNALAEMYVIHYLLDYQYNETIAKSLPESD